MIRINLLPHREAKRKAKRQQFYVLLGLVSVLAGLVVFFVYGVIGARISEQEARNAFLKSEIAILNKQIAEIKDLREKTQALLARKQVIESLQGDRAEAVHLLNELARQVPEGVYLKSLKQTGRQIQLVGYTQSNSRVSTLMRNLEASPWVEAPKLIEVKAVTLAGRRLSEFGMTATMTRAQPTAPPAAAQQQKGAKK